MNWTSIIQDLLGAGMTQVEIANCCDTGQGHISDLMRGKRRQPGWDLGNRLLSLHAERCEKSEQVAA